jgi:hypothetical protein
LLGQEKGGGDETGAYDVVPGWLKPPNPEGWVPGPITAIFAESPDRVFLIERGELPLPEKVKPGPGAMFGATGRSASGAVSQARRENYVLVVDRNGKVVENWTQWDKLWDGSRGPHHIKISPYDPEKHVWIIDDDLQQVLKFTNHGEKLVMTIGERLVSANDSSHFGRPTDIAWLPDGTFFVSDGYINTRVLKFDKDGKFLMTWGTPGSGPGQFKSPVHAVGYSYREGSERLGSGWADEQISQVRSIWQTAVLLGDFRSVPRWSLGRSPILCRPGRQHLYC